MAMTMAGMPKTMAAPRQPNATMIGAPSSATTTVPTLPPAMWALMAKPRRSSGNCSASRPLPTGCCGEPPMRDRTLARAKLGKPEANAWATNPPPNNRPPAPRRRRRETRRVSDAKLSCTIPAAKAPPAARKAIVSTPTWKSSVICR